MWRIHRVCTSGNFRSTKTVRYRAVTYLPSRRGVVPAHGHSAMLQLEVGIRPHEVVGSHHALVHQFTVVLQQLNHPDNQHGVNARGAGSRQGAPQQAHHKKNAVDFNTQPTSVAAAPRL